MYKELSSHHIHIEEYMHHILHKSCESESAYLYMLCKELRECYYTVHQSHQYSGIYVYIHLSDGVMYVRSMPG